MVSGRAERKGSSDSVSEIYILCCRQHLAPRPCSYSLFFFWWRFAQYRVGNAVTLTSSVPILAFTTAHVFLANINWHNTTVLYAHRIYFYLNLCKSSNWMRGPRYISLYSSYTGYGQLEVYVSRYTGTVWHKQNNARHFMSNKRNNDPHGKLLLRNCYLVTFFKINCLRLKQNETRFDAEVSQHSSGGHTH